MLVSIVSIVKAETVYKLSTNKLKHIKMDVDKPILISFELRLKLIVLFNRFDNHLPLVNVSLQYQIAYGNNLVKELPKRFDSLDQLFRSLEDLFEVNKMDGNVFHVRCFVRSNNLEYCAETQKVSLNFTSLKEMRPFFSADDFQHIEYILESTRKKPITTKQFSEKFFELSETHFNPLKYGFIKIPQMFLTFASLFNFSTALKKTLNASTTDYNLKASITNSLADLSIQLVAK